MTALLLRDRGMEVHTLFIRMTGSRTEELALESAAGISQTIGGPFHVSDMQGPFRKKVMEYFFRTYEAGLTPNPCVICNPVIKLEALLQTADALGIDLVATGHYARVVKKACGEHLLSKAADESKDQSYFLHRADSRVLERLLLPLGDLTRQEVEAMAREEGLSGLIQKESQDVCFLQGSYRNWLHNIPENLRVPGPIKTADGTIKGEHRGLCCYTIGQRRGLGIPDRTPYYVIRIEPDYNTLVIGKKEELFRETCRVENVHWLARPSEFLSSTIEVKLRSRQEAVRARITRSSHGDSCVTVEFEEPQRAVTPGQFAVFYKGRLVLGGGVICR